MSDVGFDEARLRASIQGDLTPEHMDAIVAEHRARAAGRAAAEAAIVAKLSPATGSPEDRPGAGTPVGDTASGTVDAAVDKDSAMAAAAIDDAADEDIASARAAPPTAIVARVTPVPEPRADTPVAGAAAPDAVKAAVAATAAAEFVPAVESLASMPGTGTIDPNELIRNRHLCRGGSCLFVGPTGIGKSSLIVQLSLSWTLGRPVFGLEPVRPLRVWIVQAENDRQDMGEMRDGVCRSMAANGLASAEDLDAAARLISVFTEDSVCGEKFGRYLIRILSDVEEEERPDIVIVDPVFAFFGDDPNSVAAVSAFCRTMLNPILHKFNVGLLLCHHVNKPQPTSAFAAGPASSDFAYLGAGPAEWANWARCILSLQAVRGSDGLYLLRAAKRGRRLGWLDAEGNSTTTRYIAHAREPGTIFWREPDADELPAASVAAGVGRPSKNPGEFLDGAKILAAGRPIPVAEFKAELQARYNIGENLATKVVTLAIGRKVLDRRRVALGRSRVELIGLPGEVEAERDRMLSEYRNPEIRLTVNA